MLNTFTMTPEQEQDARAKAFYLLKKWTSLTFLNHAVNLYRNFLDAYAKQLNTPSENQEELESHYACVFLRPLVQMEDGIEILRMGANKRSAYRALVAGSERSGDQLFGRSADELGRVHDPFFQALGLRDTNYTDSIYATGYAEGVWIAELSCGVLKCTANLDFTGLLTAGKRADGGTRIFEHWTYESIFQDARFPAWRHWPPGRNYPPVLPPCPPQNESNGAEVNSGQEIPVEGIWEPWLAEGKVGCPNYFLKGSIAHPYLLEGSNDERPVRWRLLWEDDRYRGGSLPAEEAALFLAVAPQLTPRALPGALCPRSGYWQHDAARDTVFIEAGTPMPGPEQTPWGVLIWRFCDPQPAD
ncbi:Imm72 family immunity protein [Paraburkholderia acidisoli]|uniref:Immunity protein 72 of polymorphic toxin system n=1 Tax=Paraburkholderia acidisoli TaxID=2571748 RepID=A0A7Z2GQC1_9BURK|nr:Imm72 family immunity protein [Paraburkholderia acidisoli]QGZ66046.1 hypothetical protein FAZ98_29975 [Paraburkholderia acidisoli]